MRVVLDTNVLLCVLISRHGATDTICPAWRAARFELVTSRHQFDEPRRASCHFKFHAVLQPHRVATMINNPQRAIVLDRLFFNTKTDDPGDAVIVAMAIAGDADYLVTGDRCAGLLQKGNLGRTRVFNPANFCLEVLAYHPPG